MYIVHHTTYLLLWRYLVTNPHRFVPSTFSQFVLSWFLMCIVCESSLAASAVVVFFRDACDDFSKVHALIPNFSLFSSPDVFHHFTFNSFLPSTLYCTCISTSVVVVVVVFFLVFFIRWTWLGSPWPAFCRFNLRTHLLLFSASFLVRPCAASTHCAFIFYFLLRCTPLRLPPTPLIAIWFELIRMLSTLPMSWGKPC